MGLFRRHPVRADALSAYIDGALSGAELARVEGHLQACERCRATAAELRAVRGALQELPHERAPRSFALRQTDVEAPRRAAPSGFMRASPMLGAVATIALLVFFSLVGLDVADGPSGGDKRASGTGGTALELADPEYAADMSQFSERDGEEAGVIPPDAAGTALPGFLTADIAKATAPALLPEDQAVAANADATEAPPLAATAADVDLAGEDDDGRTGLRAAEAATAAVALVAGGTFVLAWRRRRV